VLPPGHQAAGEREVIVPTPLKIDLESVDKRFDMSRTKASALNEPALPYTAS